MFCLFVVQKSHLRRSNFIWGKILFTPKHWTDQWIMRLKMPCLQLYPRCGAQAPIRPLPSAAYVPFKSWGFFSSWSHFQMRRTSQCLNLKKKDQMCECHTALWSQMYSLVKSKHTDSMLAPVDWKPMYIRQMQRRSESFGRFDSSCT